MKREHDPRINDATEVSRRAFLRLAWAGSVTTLLAACAPASAPAPGTTKPAAQPTSAAAAKTDTAPKTQAAKTQAAPNAAAPAAAGKARTRVRYGDLKLLGDAGIYIALDEGYFADEGIELELVSFDSAANMVAPLSTNQLEAGGGALSAGLYNAMARGVDLRIVADKGHNDPTPPGFPINAFPVRKALLDSGEVKTVADLKGRKFAQVAQGISPELDIAAFLKTGGLEYQDVEITLMSFPDMITAFATGSVDVGQPVDPFTTIIQQQGTGVVMKYDYEVHPNHQVAVLFYSPGFSAAPHAPGFMTAYLRGVRLYNDAFLKKDATAMAKAVSALTAHTQVKDPAMYDKMKPNGLHPDGTMNRESFEEQQQWFMKRGLQQTHIDISKYLDLQHAEAAVKQLGPYKR